MRKTNHKLRRSSSSPTEMGDGEKEMLYTNIKRKGTTITTGHLRKGIVDAQFLLGHTADR